jgi:hypothetical protein
MRCGVQSIFTHTLSWLRLEVKGFHPNFFDQLLLYKRIDTDTETTGISWNLSNPNVDTAHTIVICLLVSASFLVDIKESGH